MSTIVSCIAPHTERRLDAGYVYYDAEVVQSMPQPSRTRGVHQIVLLLFRNKELIC